MNEPKKTDFFPEINENHSNLVGPNRYEPYQDTAQDLLHDERLAEIEAIIKEKDSTFSENDLGELPFDEEADVQRWNELEKEFDCVFNEAKDLNY
ncbi:MAG TPA: hypothetical protein PKY82_01345 [Pyrinomonadaceae bacterium]|nr:hypothetical protein [Pyrinomonadaceae bacterium]